MNEVEIRIGGRDDTGQAVASAERRMDGLKKVGQTAAAGLGAAGAAAGGMFAAGLAANMNLEVANDKLAAQLGLTEKEAAVAGEVAGDIYAANWGGSIEEVNAAIKSVGDNLGDVSKMSKEELEGMATSALALAQVFEVDVAESTQAAGSMIKNGLAKNSTEAFDLITAGMQEGLNKSGDFLETLNEYSPHFKKLGIEGPQAIGLLSQFLKAGARDTDYAADAIKEFSIRAVDGSATTIDGFKSLGFNAKLMGDEIGKGGMSAQAGLSEVIDRLKEVKDPLEQDRIGVELFGTQWEDTVRQVLPNLDLTTAGLENVDGATKRMADTVGDNAAGKIETMKRGFEQWTQRMAESEGTMGLVATGAAQFGGQAVGLAGNLGMVALAFKGLGAALLMNPIGLVVLAIAGLAAGMVILWQKSDKAREVMSLAFAAIATHVLTQANIMLRVFDALSNGVLSMVEITLRALGKIPGNDWATRAADDVKGFKDAADEFFNGAIRKTEEWRTAAQNMPKKIVLEADEEDLQAKLRHSQESLKKLPRNKRTVIQAEIDQAQRAIANVQARLRGIPDRYVSVFVTEVARDRATAARGKASGGITGAASGGIRSGLTRVGEQGPELVKLPFGSTVMSHGSSENAIKKAMDTQAKNNALSNALLHSAKRDTGVKIAKAVTKKAKAKSSGSSIDSGYDTGGWYDGGGGGGEGADVTILFTSDGSKLGDLLLEITRKSVRARGGNVQLVLGH